MRRPTLRFVLFSVLVLTLVTGPGPPRVPIEPPPTGVRPRGVGCSGGARGVGCSGGARVAPRLPTGAPKPVPKPATPPKVAPRPVAGAPRDPHVPVPDRLNGQREVLSAHAGRREWAFLALAARARPVEAPGLVGRHLEALEASAGGLKDLAPLRDLAHGPWPEAARVEDIEAGLAAFGKTAAPDEAAVLRRYFALRAEMEGRPEIAQRLLRPGEARDTPTVLRDLKALGDIDAELPPVPPLGELPQPEPTPLGLKAGVRHRLDEGLPGLADKLPDVEPGARRGALRAIESSAGMHWHHVAISLHNLKAAEADGPDDREAEVERRLGRPLTPEERLLAGGCCAPRRPPRWPRRCGPRRRAERRGRPSMIRYQCPRCGRERESDDGLAGMTVICLGCGERFVVPLLSLLGRREGGRGAPCPPPTPVPCPPLDLLRRALAGELSAEEPAALSRHLDGCPTCRLELARLAEAHRVVPEAAPSDVRPDRDAGPRRRLRRWACALLLLAGLLAWRFWPRTAPEAAPPAPGWPSPLDVLDPARLTDADWPRADRAAEAVGVLPLDRDADGRLDVSITRESVVLINNARGQEVVRIDAYAPPRRGGGGVIIDPRTGQIIGIDPSMLNLDLRAAEDRHNAVAAVLSPKADRLVVLGATFHKAGTLASIGGDDHDGTGEWAQVWRWEGGALTPLEAQPLERLGARGAAFSADGKLLATTSDKGVDVWEVGDKALTHRGKISGEWRPLLFAPDGRSLAVVKPGAFALYDLGPILPGGSGWARWHLLWVALALGAAAAVFIPVSYPGEAARARRRLSSAGRAAALGVGACVGWWAWRPVPAGAPLTVGLCFGSALAVLLFLAWARRRWPDGGADNAVLLITCLGAVVCLALWAWQFWWPSPSLLTPSRSDLAGADVKSAAFSADGRELAVVRTDGRLSLFDAATGKETRSWDMPPGVARPEYADDGRHLLAVAEGKAYVLRLRPFDDDAFVLSCCEKVLSRNPESAEALLARGHVRLRKGELDEAIADFTAAIRLDGKNAAAYLARGQALTDRGDYAAAKADFAAAVLIDPKLADPPKGK
jgi:hypothetical protein